MSTGIPPFPRSFKFGVADADLQVIGEASTLAEEGAAPTMWAHHAERSHKVFRNHTPLEGIDRYHRYAEDVELLKELGVRHYRTSVSMSRLLREDGSVNEHAAAWYRRYFELLREAGIEVSATLYHWELPRWLDARGGWVSRDSIDAFVRHTVAAHEALGDLVSEYYLVNEHVCIVFLGYHLGMHAPFEEDFGRALQAGHHLLVAQGRAFRALKQRAPGVKVSTVYNPTSVYAASCSDRDLHARNLTQGYHSDWLLEPIFTGRYPEHLVEAWEEYLPDVRPDDMEEMKVGADLTTLGLNYYMGKTVKFDPAPVTKAAPVRNPFERKTGLGWPVYIPPFYPPGLYDLLVTTFAKYSLFGLRSICITENGTACLSDADKAGGLDDDFRIEYVRAHLEQVSAAIRAGVPVEGYYLWTLMDNYEWQEGYRPESAFGLVHVDRATLARKPKKSFGWYREVVRRHLVAQQL
jgi:beta-glucosidase